jgi:hypothetical protein
LVYSNYQILVKFLAERKFVLERFLTICCRYFFPVMVEAILLSKNKEDFAFANYSVADPGSGAFLL